MIIDFHTHCFPDSLAERAFGKLSEIAKTKPHNKGTADALVAFEKENGSDYAVVCNIATNDKQTTNVNNFAIETAAKYPTLYPLGSLFPESDEEFVFSEAKRLHDAGVPGIKIHPDYAGIEFDDSRYDKIYRACIENNLFVMTHAGWDFISPDHIHCTPDMIINVINRFPDLCIVAAHCGSNRMIDEVTEKLAGKEIYFDLSLSELNCYSEDQIRRLCDRHDSEMILFGSDAPWCVPSENREYIKKAIGEGELYEKFCGKNAARLLSGAYGRAPIC